MPTDASQIHADPVHVEVYDDDVDLRHHLRALWGRRFLIIAVTIVTTFLGFAFVWSTPPTYEASVTLARISTLKIGDQAVADTALSFRALLQNRRLADEVIREFSLDRAPYGLTPASFVGSAVRVEDLDGATMILAKVTLAHSPDLVAKAANRLAERAVELNRQMNQAEAATARDFIKLQLDEARGALDAIERRLVERQQQAQIGAVQADVDAILSSRRQLLAMSVEIAGEKARLAKAEEELSRRERILPAPRNVDASAALLDANRRAEAADASAWAARQAVSREAARRPEEPGGRHEEPSRRQEEVESRRQDNVPFTDPLNLRSDFVNPVYEALDYQVAASRTRLASLQEQERRLREAVHPGVSNPTLANLYSRRIDLVRLETEHALVNANYSELSRRYEQARIQVASGSSQLEIIDPAMPPEHPVAPRPLRTIATAAILGLFAGVAAALLLGYLAPMTAAAVTGPVRRDRASV